MNTTRPHRTPDPAGGGAARRDRAAPRRPGADWDGRDPEDVRRAVREHVAGRSRSSPGRSSRRSGPALVARVREKVHLVAVPLLSCCPSLPLAAPRGAVLRACSSACTSGATRRPHVKPDEERVLELAALEDHVVQNPFMAIGHVKPGRFRRLDARS